MANPAEPISGQICWPSPGSFTGHQRAHQLAARGQNEMAIDTGVTTRVYAALNLPDKVARPLRLRYLLDDITSAGAARLVLESDASLEKADRRVIASYLASVDATGKLEYGHRRPHEEPLLWVSDAVA